MSNLIPSPVLDGRSGEEIAAEAIARVSGGLTAERINRQIEILRQLLLRVEGGTLALPICPELTNANPSSPHTVLLEAQAWLVEQIQYLINQLPRRDEIEFARLFGAELREATRATTTLTFTVDAPPNTTVTIPAGTQVSTNDESVVFATAAALVIPPGTLSGNVAATAMQTGGTLLSPNVLTRMIDTVTSVWGVTNLQAVDSGSEAETIEDALARARSYQRRAERIVTARDLEEAVLQDVLQGYGIVKAFPFVAGGDFTIQRPGHTTLVVMTPTGAPVSSEVKAQITALMQQAIGSQFIYVVDPSFVDFNVAADVRFNSLTSQVAAKAAAERNLRNFYAPKISNFGRAILRAEIIAVIEATDGVSRIEAPAAGAILGSPTADATIAPYAFPRLLDVTLNAV